MRTCKRSCGWIAVLLVFGWARSTNATEPLAVPQDKPPQRAHQITNATLQVRWAAETREALLADDQGQVFARLKFAHSVSAVRAVNWKDKRLGVGRQLQLVFASGGMGTITLPAGTPFALVRATIAGDRREERVVNRITPFRFVLDLPDVEHCKALGTAGLTDPDKHSGSYAFLAIASPMTRKGVVSGWLSHDRGSGIVCSSIANGKVELQPRIEYGCLRIPPGKSTGSECFAIGPFDDARLGLEAYADAIAKYYAIHLPPIMTGYCSWYHSPHGGANDEVHLAELARQAARQLKPCGFQFVQIDDKWQAGQRRNGPANDFFAHAPNGPYPSGMKKTADRIRALGLVPGLWFMPFAGDRQDPFFQQHLDWFVQRADGTPYWAKWGGTSLDMTNPAARQYVRGVVDRIAHKWGYQYFKMDGLWVGTATKLLYVNNAYREDDIGAAVFHDRTKTNIEAFRDGLKLVRDAAGPDVFFLGCCVSQNMRSFGGSFGLVDAMRIGPDNGAAKSWKQLLRGPWHGTNRYFLHGRVWYNDPDPIGVSTKIPLDQARVICSWVTLTGQLNVFSEWLPQLPAERIDLLRRTMPNHGLRPRPVDLFEHELANVWLLTDTRHEPRRDVVGVFNWAENRPLKVDYETARIGLPDAGAYIGFDYWMDELVPTFSDRLRCELPGGTCRVLAVRPECDHPQLISTSQHITQGIVDVTAEKWDAPNRTLRGTSLVVAGDPYELRIVLPNDAAVWKTKHIDVESGQVHRKVSVTTAQEGRLLRVRIPCAHDGMVDWQIKFAP